MMVAADHKLEEEQYHLVGGGGIWHLLATDHIPMDNHVVIEIRVYLVLDSKHVPKLLNAKEDTESVQYIIVLLCEFLNMN